MEQTIQKLENVLEPLNLLMENIQVIEGINSKKKEIETRQKSLKKGIGYSIISIIISIYVFFILLISVVLLSEGPELIVPLFIKHIIIGVIVGILGACATRLMFKNISRKQMIRNEKELEQCNTQIARVADVVKTQALNMRENIDIVPVDYRYPLAVEYIYKCLKNQRAATIGEAINLYEDQIHKWKMESMQQEIMQTCLKQQQDMKQIKNLSAISAAAGIASLFQ